MRIARMKEVVLVRHGHTAANELGPDAPMSGWYDVPLSPRGARQIQFLADELRRTVFECPLYASPLQRTRDTALALVGGDVDRLRLEPDLREISCGDFEAASLRSVEYEHPELWATNLRQEDDDFRWPGGESYREFRARALACLDRLVADSPCRKFVVVTHAGFISQIVGTLRGSRPARWGAHRVGNASITTVAWWNGRGRLLSFNDESHLTDAPQDDNASARLSTRAHVWAGPNASATWDGTPARKASAMRHR